MPHNIPDNWFRHACENAHISLAFVKRNHIIVWCNPSFGRLIGYAVNELVGKTWMDITLNEDIGADMKSINGIIEGESQLYSLQKRYVHKMGHEIPVVLTAFRFPIGTDELIGFTIEALEVSNEDVIVDIFEEQKQEVIKLQTRIDKLEKLFTTINILGEFCLKWLPIGAAIIGGLYGLLQLIIMAFKNQNP